MTNNLSDKFMNGTLDLIILSFLSQRPYYATEIYDLVNDNTDEEFKLSPNVLFTVMHFMSDKNLITHKLVKSGDRNRYYCEILPAGREYYEKLKDYYFVYKRNVEHILSMNENLS